MKEHFEKFLGLGNATDNENDLLAYSYDASEMMGSARVVLFPSHEEQLRLILSYANRTNIDVVARGNGTNLMGMTIPNNSIVLCTQGLDKIHALNVREKWVNVETGVTIAELNEALRKDGFRFPLEPFTAPQTTIGAFIAINGCSRHSQKYGRAVDNILELELMDGTGKFFSVKKDFEQCVGNEGSALIIVRAKLRVIPIVDRSADLHYFDSVQEAIVFADKVKEDKPLAIEFLDGAAATYAGIHTKHTIIVEWEHADGKVRYEDYAALIKRREGVRRALGIKGFVYIDDGQLEEYARADAIEWCRKHDVPVIAHIGIGVVHPFFKKEPDERHLWYAWLTEHQQLHAGQFGWGLRKKMYVPQALRLKIRQLKERYDYNDTLGRGKLHDYI